MFLWMNRRLQIWYFFTEFYWVSSEKGRTDGRGFTSAVERLHLGQTLAAGVVKQSKVVATLWSPASRHCIVRAVAIKHRIACQQPAVSLFTFNTSERVGHFLRRRLFASLSLVFPLVYQFLSLFQSSRYSNGLSVKICARYLHSWTPLDFH